MQRGKRRFKGLVFLLAAFVLTGTSGCYEPVTIVEDLAKARSGVKYCARLVTGGTGTYVLEGELPEGLTFYPNGTISGTVTGEEEITFTVTARDNGALKFLCTDPVDTRQAHIAFTEEPYRWTVLVHFAVDNNISYLMEQKLGLVSDYLATLEALKLNDQENVLRICLMMDADTPERFAEGYYFLSGDAFARDLALATDEINSGAMSSTRAFMDWALDTHASGQFSSARYLYSVFNHGSGFADYGNIYGNPSGTEEGDGLSAKGIGFDENSDDDCLTHYELGELTAYLQSKIGRPLDLFYPFACLMGGVELTYAIKDHADFVLFSEESFPADLWSYEALGVIVQNPGRDVPPDEVGIAFCDSASDYFERIILSRDFTLSLVDLSDMDALAGALDTYATAALADLDTHAALYNQAADDSFTMLEGIEDGEEAISNYFYLDLGDYIDHISATSGLPQAVYEAAGEVRAAIDESVVYQTSYGFANASGLSIFHNIWGSENRYPPQLYKNLFAFGADNAWSDYAAEMTYREDS